MDRWSDCLTAYASLPKDRIVPDAARLIAWRGRGSVASSMLGPWLGAEGIGAQERQALLRATDFLSGEDRQRALRGLLENKDSALVIEGLMRLDGIDVNEDPRLAELVRERVKKLGNDPSQLKLIQRDQSLITLWEFIGIFKIIFQNLMKTLKKVLKLVIQFINNFL
jgi:hypothetical protein